MSSPSSPNSLTATIIKPRKSNDLRYLFRSPEGKLIFERESGLREKTAAEKLCNTEQFSGWRFG